MEPSCLHRAFQVHHINTDGQQVICRIGAAIKLTPDLAFSLTCWTRGADAKHPPHESLHTINCNFNSCHLTRKQNPAFQTAVTGLQGSIQKPTKRNNYKLFVQQMTIVQYKSIQYCFCYILALDHKMLFCVLTEMLHLTQLQ